MKLKIILGLILLVVSSLAFVSGFYYGTKSAYEDIISEKCRLNKESRDIECIVYIAD